MRTILLIFIGSGLGGLLRYGISTIGSKDVLGHFPWHTFVINIVACIIVGIILGFLGAKSAEYTAYKELLVVGFCGGFSTFSTFSVESLQLIQTGAYWQAAFYVGGSILLGISAVLVGIGIAKMYA